MNTRTRTQAQAQAFPPPPSPVVAAQQAQQQNQGTGGGGGGGGGGPGGGDDGGDNPNVGIPIPQAPVPGPFALTPAMVDNNPLDFTQVQAIKLFYKASQALEIVYDLSTDRLKLFLESFRQRAIESNWWQTLQVNRDGMNYNLVDHYGVLTYEEVRQRVQMYQGTNTRNAQNAIQIFTCLSNSLTPDAKSRVFVEADKYNVNNSPDGLLFLKVIIQLSHIDTNATITMIRTRLSSLDVKMATLQDNIVEFNEYVKAQVIGLSARGEHTNDLLVNLFKGYKTVADPKFVQYIEGKEDNYNEGQDIQPQALMELAQAKYKTMLERGDWKTPTESEKKIVALTAQLQKLQKEKKSWAKKENKNKNDKKEKGKKGDDKTNKVKWWLQEPKSGEPKTMTKNKKEYHWCPNHEENGKWVRHKPSDCNAKKDNKPKESAPEKKESNKLVPTNIREVDSEDEEY